MVILAVEPPPHASSRPRRIVVACRFEAGSLFAHAINTVKMAQGFARLGHRVTIICRRGEDGRRSRDELARRYALDAEIRWVQLPRRLPGPKRWINTWFAGLALPAILRARPDLVYARDYGLPTLTSRLGLPTVAETHAHPDKAAAAFLAMTRAATRPATRAWVTISPVLADHYHTLGVPREKLLVLPDAVDLRQFARPDTLPPDPFEDHPGPNVVYAGHLYDYKGIPTVLDAAARLPNVRFHLVGGWPEDIARQRHRIDQRRLANVRLHGLLPQPQLPPLLWHADALLLPPSADHPSAAWTSPVKLGEYLAARSPVLAARIPALGRWVTDEEVAYFTPDDPADLAAALRRVLGDPAGSRRRTDAGWRKAQQFSYQARAAAILERALGPVG